MRYVYCYRERYSCALGVYVYDVDVLRSLFVVLIRFFYRQPHSFTMVGVHMARRLRTSFIYTPIRTFTESQTNCRFCMRLWYVFVFAPLKSSFTHLLNDVFRCRNCCSTTYDNSKCSGY